MPTQATITCDDSAAITFPPRALADIRQALTEHGHAHITGLPDTFDYPAALTAFGPLIPQYSGELVRDIRPQPEFDGMISALNTGKVWPHTEWYEFPDLPPRYLALWCIHPADGPGGETTLVDGHRLLGEFTPADLDRLRQPVYQFGASASLARIGVQEQACHELVTEDRGTTIVRFSTLDLIPDNELVTRWIVTGVAIHAAHHTPIKIKPGELLIWDNWRILHARNAFTDRRRHLRRALIGSA
jgi:hypothetical protein